MKSHTEYAAAAVRDGADLAAIEGAILAYNAELLGEIAKLRAAAKPIDELRDDLRDELRERSKHWAAALNRRVDVETLLFAAAAGKRPLPDAEECRALALRLGVPDNGGKA